MVTLNFAPPKTMKKTYGIGFVPTVKDIGHQASHLGVGHVT